jgi:hypothetical protein
MTRVVLISMEYLPASEQFFLSIQCVVTRPQDLSGHRPAPDLGTRGRVSSSDASDVGLLGQ